MGSECAMPIQLVSVNVPLPRYATLMRDRRGTAGL